jgi:hypothetical protein
MFTYFHSLLSSLDGSNISRNATTDDQQILLIYIILARVPSVSLLEYTDRHQWHMIALIISQWPKGRQLEEDCNKCC